MSNACAIQLCIQLGDILYVPAAENSMNLAVVSGAVGGVAVLLIILLIILCIIIVIIVLRLKRQNPDKTAVSGECISRLSWFANITHIWRLFQLVVGEYATHPPPLVYTTSLWA